MTAKKRLMFVTIGVWAAITIAYAAYYAITRSTADSSVGYETWWHWQLGFFAITRLPFLLAGLGIVLFIEARSGRTKE